MAFADDLDELSPAGSDLISLGDDAIRKLARAVSERLISAFQDPDVDPMVIKNGAIGSLQLNSTQQLRSILQFSRSVSGGPIGAGLGASFTGAAVGAVVGDHVLAVLSGPASIAAVDGLIIRGYISAPDTYTIRVFNPSAAGVTINDTVLISVIKAVMIP